MNGDADEGESNSSWALCWEKSGARKVNKWVGAWRECKRSSSPKRDKEHNEEGREIVNAG